jgi:hypothetical protein
MSMTKPVIMPSALRVFTKNSPHMAVKINDAIIDRIVIIILEYL